MHHTGLLRSLRRAAWTRLVRLLRDLPRDLPAALFVVCTYHPIEKTVARDLESSGPLPRSKRLTAKLQMKG